VGGTSIEKEREKESATKVQEKRKKEREGKERKKERKKKVAHPPHYFCSNPLFCVCPFLLFFPSREEREEGKPK
jgi:hypothetical protein